MFQREGTQRRLQLLRDEPLGIVGDDARVPVDSLCRLTARRLLCGQQLAQVGQADILFTHTLPPRLARSVKSGRPTRSDSVCRLADVARGSGASDVLPGLGMHLAGSCHWMS